MMEDEYWGEIMEDEYRSEERRGIIKVICITIILCVLAHFAIMKFFNMAVVVGDSMFPAYTDGDILICTKEFDESSLQRGDIIVYTYEGKPCVKRIIGIPGDSVGVSNGKFVVNGVTEENGLPPIADSGILTDGAITLNDSEFFCAGDNRNNSTDSRVQGVIPISNINMKVLKKFQLAI